MSDVEARLAAALGADAPPERDALFRLGVLARIERARFRRRILWTVAIGLMASMLIAVNAATIDTWIAADWRHSWIVGAAAVAVVLALPGMPTAAMPGMRTVVKVFGRLF
jgi:FtsH-binding integral membrane protein